MTSKRHFPHRHQEPQNRFRAAGEERSPRSGRPAYPCKATLKIQLVNLTLCSTKFSAMLHKNFGCGVLYSRMEILPKVDEAVPHWNDEHRGVMPSKKENFGHSLVSEGWVFGGRGRRSVVGICGAGLWCWLVGDTREPQWCFRDFRLSNVDQ